MSSSIRRHKEAHFNTREVTLPFKAVWRGDKAGKKGVMSCRHRGTKATEKLVQYKSAEEAPFLKEKIELKSQTASNGPHSLVPLQSVL